MIEKVAQGKSQLAWEGGMEIQEGVERQETGRRNETRPLPAT